MDDQRCLRRAATQLLSLSRLLVLGPYKTTLLACNYTALTASSSEKRDIGQSIESQREGRVSQGEQRTPWPDTIFFHR